MDADNGVKLQNIMELLAAVKGDANMGNVTFVAKSKWLGGTRTEVEISELWAGNQNIARQGRKFTLTIDEPAQLGGTDQHPNPVEYLAAGLCGCLTAGIATNSQMFGNQLEKIEVTVKMDNNLHGVLGLDDKISNGVSNIDYSVKIKGKNGKEKCIRSKETIDKKSPVLVTLKNAIPTKTRIEVIE